MRIRGPNIEIKGAPKGTLAHNAASWADAPREERGEHLAKVLDRLIAAYTFLPRHPGKGTVICRVLDAISVDKSSPRLCKRMGIRFECDLKDFVDLYIYYGMCERAMACTYLESSGRDR